MKEKDIDIRKVNRDELVDIATVQLDSKQCQEEKIKSYISQIKNPYCYIQNGVIVKLSFAGKCCVDECLEKCVSMQ
ncbi:MAG: hypothetical protein HUJ72_05595 [Blautia sp.]|nr:hypothetical protein [Blautia sp.]